MSFLSSWMKYVDGDKKLSELTIPGTHDTGAREVTAINQPALKSVQCQTLTLSEQLNLGIRFIDIRCRHINNMFKIHHGSYYLNLDFDTGVRDVCYQFLANNQFLYKNPSECIIMSIKHEYDDEGNNRSFEETFRTYLRGSERFWFLKNSIPTLNEARGKIVLFRRFGTDKPETELGIDLTDWPDNKAFTIKKNGITYNVQDIYTSYLLWNVNDKFCKYVKDNLDASTNNSDPNTLYLNFLSGGGGVYPKSLATGYMIPGFQGTNYKLMDFLHSRNPSKCGFIIMDYPEYPNNLIPLLICENDIYYKDSEIASGTYLLCPKIALGSSIDVHLGSSDNRTPLILYHKNGGKNQEFKLVEDQNNKGYFYLQANHVENKIMVVDVADFKIEDFTDVILYDIHNIPGQNPDNQLWRITREEGSFYRFSPKYAPEKALDVKGGSKEDWTSIVIYQWKHPAYFPDRNDPSELWRLIKIE